MELYTTSEDFSFFDGNLELKEKYRFVSFVSPTFHFIPFAKKTKYPAFFKGKTMNLLHFYLSYCPWSTILINNPEIDNENISFSKCQVLDAGIAYTFNVIPYFPFTIKTGYLNLYNPSRDIDSYHFPSHRFEKFYFGINISLGAWETEGLDVGDKYTVVPFIAEPFKSHRHRIAMQRDWKNTQLKGTIDAYEDFISHYPQEELSQQARIKLNQFFEQREQRDWKYAEEKNTILSYETFLLKHSGGKYEKDARSKLEMLYWEKAKRQNTMYSYKEYLYKYPYGRYVDQAKVILLQIEDYEWHTTKTKNTVEAYRAYLEKWSQGENRTAVRAAIDGLEDKMWLDIRGQSNIQAYEEFLKVFPDGKHADEVKAIIQDPDWLSTYRANTTKAYMQYLQEHPDGPHAGQAFGRVLAGARTLGARFNVTGTVRFEGMRLYNVGANETTSWNGKGPCDAELEIEAATHESLPDQISGGFFMGLPYTKVSGVIKVYCKGSFLFTMDLSGKVMGGISMGSMRGTSPTWPDDKEVLDYIHDFIQELVKNIGSHK